MALLLAALALVAATGCGGEDAEPVAIESERADEPAPLPAGWERVVVDRAGFSVGLPPGWEERHAPRGRLLRSPDGTAVVQISADRTQGALEADLEAFALGIVERLEGFPVLEIGDPEPFQSRYPAARVQAQGRTAAGVEQRIDAIVLRRPDVVAFPVTVFRSAAPEAEPIDDAELGRLLSTLRNQPPQVLQARPEADAPAAT